MFADNTKLSPNHTVQDNAIQRSTQIHAQVHPTLAKIPNTRNYLNQYLTPETRNNQYLVSHVQVCVTLSLYTHVTRRFEP